MSRDIYTLVRVVLEASVRCEDDLLALLEGPHPSRHQPTAAVVPIELHA